MQFIIYTLSLFGAIITEASIIPTDINNLVPLNISLLKIDKDLGRNPRDQIPISNRNRYALKKTIDLEISLIPISQNSSKSPQRDIGNISLPMSADPSQNPSKGLQREKDAISLLKMSEDPSPNPSKGAQRNIVYISLLPIGSDDLSQNPTKDLQGQMEDIPLIPMREEPSQNPAKGPQQEMEDVSLLPMSEDTSLTPSTGPREFELLSIIGLNQEEIEGVVKMCEGMNLETTESDLYTCAFKTVTSFIACMHNNNNMDKAGLKGPTQPVPFIKCLNEAISVFVKCLLSQPLSVTLDFVPKFAM